ncbi:hypothetical protein LSAT2_022153 [Lamellibrachia satsuma]|nr:hypothetical protein LSAT2_022153 [Lamellibrachia satsuma]
MNLRERQKISHNVETEPKACHMTGGPGSRKGRIVDDLTATYGFRFISGEDLIIRELPRKLANIVKLESAKDVRNFLEEDPSHVTLEWVLIMLERRIEQDIGMDCTYLVDLIPNLKFVLRSKNFVKDCRPAMEKFEQRYPVSFGLNLAIPADKVLETKQLVNVIPETEVLKNTGGQGDEADSGRTKMHECSRDVLPRTSRACAAFLSYFEETERLVMVDVSCRRSDFIWQHVHELLCELKFRPCRCTNSVILFAFEDADAHDIDCEKYHMEKLDLRSIVPDPMDSVENLLSSLCGHIDSSTEASDAFVIFLSGTAITQEEISQLGVKPVMFLDVTEGHLEMLLPGSPLGRTLQPNTKTYKCVSSLENDVYMFPQHVSSPVCHRIAKLMMINRRTV